jgi:microcystin-dependent protein
MIGYFCSATAPTTSDDNGSTSNEAWLACHGQSLNTYTYRRLHEVISNTFGGDAFVAGTTDQPGAATTFDLPDLRGEFIRGHNTQASGTGHDGGRAFGSSQDGQVTQHTHSQTGLQFTPGNGGPNGGQAGSNIQTGAYPATGDIVGDDETRPVNVALLPLIKT